MEQKYTCTCGNCKKISVGIRCKCGNLLHSIENLKNSKFTIDTSEYSRPKEHGIHIGDVVHLPCGGADMVVVEIDSNSNGDRFATCEWHTTDFNPVQRVYNVNLLVKGKKT